jgi:hypothetical protein
MQTVKIEVGDRMGDLDLCVFQIEVQGVAGSSPREDVDQGADLSAWWFLIHLIGSWMFTAGPPIELRRAGRYRVCVFQFELDGDRRTWRP